MLCEIYDTRFYNELFTYFKMDEVRAKEMLDCLLSYRMSRLQQEEILKKYILEIGFDNYQHFVLDYNYKILNAMASNIYPTNDEILDKRFIMFKNESASIKR